MAAFLWFAFDSQIENQKGRNKYLNDEISKLDKQIDEIKKIREETASLLAKKQVVEGLQSNRWNRSICDQLLRQLPEGLAIYEVHTANRCEDQCDRVCPIKCARFGVYAEYRSIAIFGKSEFARDQGRYREQPASE